MTTKNVVDLPVAGAGTLVGTDKILVVDISDTTEGPLGTVKIAAGTTLAQLFDVLTAAGLTAVVNNGIVYVNSAGALTSGSELQFDGNNLGLGATSTHKLTVNGNVAVGGQKAFWWRDDDGFSGAGDRRAWAAGANIDTFGALSIKVASAANGDPLAGLTAILLDSARNWLPGTDNTQNIGSGALRMAVIYAGTGTINTSDAREKTDVSPMTLAEKAAAQDLAAEIGTFQFLASVAEKGDAARHHVGMTVQRAIEIMESHGLNPFKYGFICYDSWDAETKEVVAEDGAYSRVVERQAFTEKQVDYIEVVDGVPVKKSRTEKEPRYVNAQVIDAAGNPVDGLVHPVPVMESVTERYNIETVREAGDRYSFRTDQLALFILGGMVA